MSEAIMTTTQAAKLWAEAQVGGERVRVIEEDWIRWMQEGVIVDPTVRRFTMVRALRPRDIGLYLSDAAEQEWGKVMKLGDRYLLPKPILNKAASIEKSIRQIAQGLGAFRTHWGWFVPFTAWPKFKEATEDRSWEYPSGSLIETGEVLDTFAQLIRDGKDAGQPINFVTQYHLLGRYIETNFQLIRQWVREDNAAVAADVYQTVRDAYPTQMAHDSVEAFAVDYVERLDGELKDIGGSAVGASYEVTYDLEFIPLPSMLAADFDKAETIRIGTEAKRQAAYVENEKRQLELKQARSSAQTKIDMMEDMHRDVVNEMRRGLEEKVFSFVDDLRGQVMENFYVAATSIKAYLEENGSLSPRHSQQITNLLAVAQNQVFFEWPEAEAMMKKLQGMMDKTPADRKPEQVRSILIDIQNISKDVLTRMGDNPRVPITATLADAPKVAMRDLNESRVNLGLTELKVPTARSREL